MGMYWGIFGWAYLASEAVLGDIRGSKGLGSNSVFQVDA